MSDNGNRIAEKVGSPIEARLSELSGAMAEKAKAMATLKEGIRAARKQRDHLEREVVAIRFAIDELRKVAPKE